MTGQGPPPQTTDAVGARRTRPRDMIARGVLTLALVGLIVWLLASNVGERHLLEGVDHLGQLAHVACEQPHDEADERQRQDRPRDHVARPRAPRPDLVGRLRRRAPPGHSGRTTQRKPMWVVDVSTVSDCRAAGR